MVDGQMVIRDRQHQSLDLAQLRAESQKAADALAVRAQVDHFKSRKWRSMTA